MFASCYNDSSFDTAYLALPCPPVSFRVHTHKDDNILGGTGLFDRRSNMKQNILLRVAPCGLLLPHLFTSPSNKTIFFQKDCYDFQDRNDNTSNSKIASSATPNWRGIDIVRRCLNPNHRFILNLLFRRGPSSSTPRDCLSCFFFSISTFRSPHRCMIIIILKNCELWFRGVQYLEDLGLDRSKSFQPMTTSYVFL